MLPRLSMRSLAVLACVAMAACGGDSPTGPAAVTVPDVGAITQQQTDVATAMHLPAIYSLLGDYQGSVSLAMAPTSAAALARASRLMTPSDPRAIGATLHSVVQASLARIAVPSRISSTSISRSTAPADPYVDPQLWGRTYVEGPYGLEWDSTRTDAPARGVRLVLYERTGATFSPAVVGALDVIDSSTANGQVGRVNLFDKDGVSNGSMRETSTGSYTATGSTGQLTYLGTLGLSPKMVTFADTLTVTTTASTTVGRLLIATAAPFSDLDVRMEARYDMKQDTGTVTGTIKAKGHTIRAEGAVSMAEGADLGTGKISLDGTVVATTSSSHAGTYYTPNGSGPISSTLQTYLDAVFSSAGALPDGDVFDTKVGELMPLY